MDPPRFRLATADDAEAIAQLNAEIWRPHDRGASSDAFVDLAAEAKRRLTWRTRFADPVAETITLVADTSGELVGLAHSVLDADPEWGCLLADLQVRPTHLRQGLGSRLLSLTAMVLLQRQPASRLYAWVLTENTAARAFCQARGGRLVESAPVGASLPRGSPPRHRYVWADPMTLLGDV